MQAGQLKHRVQIERWDDSQIGLGAEDQSWSLFATVWAGQTPFSYMPAKFAANREQGQEVVSWVIRWLAGLTPNNFRVTYRGRHYRIVDIEELKPYRELLLICLEIMPGPTPALT